MPIPPTSLHITTSPAPAGSGRPRRARLRGPRWLPPLALGALLGLLGLLVYQAATGRDSAEVGGPGVIDASPDVSVTLSEGLLTALIRRSVEQGESPVKLEHVRVETRPGRIVVYGDVSVLGRGVGGRIDLVPSVAGGRLRMRVLQAKLGPLPAPANLERLVEGPVNARLAAAVGDLPAEVTSARVDTGGLTVTARVRVDALRPGQGG